MTESKRADPPRFNCKTAVLCWNPGTAEVALVRWGTGADLDRFQMTGLAVYTNVHGLTFDQRKALVFIEAVHLIVRDRCDPRAVHRALLGLEEYQAGLAEDALWETFPS